MKLAIIGSGYVGLVTGTCFAETGNQVICVDIDKAKVQRMQDGEIPIYEPGLDVIFERNKRQGRLIFLASLQHSIQQATVCFNLLLQDPIIHRGFVLGKRLRALLIECAA